MKNAQTYERTQTAESPATEIIAYPSNSIEWLKRLIRFDTTSRDSNLALIDDVRAYCETLGLTDTIHLTYNDDHNKANLFVTVPASAQALSGEAGKLTGGIVLSGHTDVVPVDGQAWTSNPFEPEIRDDKLYGRGSCDMKGFIACSLVSLIQATQLQKLGVLTRPLHLALSYDEEIGCLGAPVMLADIAERGIHPDYCIVGEPSNMQMVVAHKGINVFRCRVHGKSVHSSLTPQGVNAISYASRLIGYIDELANELTSSNHFDELFDVPFSTLSVGLIKGGTASNIVPNLCEFIFDYRNLPFMTLHDVLTPIQSKIDSLNEKMQAIDTDSYIELEEMEQVPSMTDSDSEALQTLVRGLLNEQHLSQEDNSKKKVAYATEGGQFTNAGIPTIICGPGSIEQAHKLDEFVSLEQLTKCDIFLQKLLDSLSRPSLALDKD